MDSRHRTNPRSSRADLHELSEPREEQDVSAEDDSKFYMPRPKKRRIDVLHRSASDGHAATGATARSESRVRHAVEARSGKQVKKPTLADRSKSLPECGPQLPISRPLAEPPRAKLLFSSLKFYFFPNNRTNKARAMKIDKAIKFGADWCKEWQSDATHIIVDDGLRFEDFAKFHKDFEPPQGNTVFVNSRYVADCIVFGFIISPNQKAYQVPGHADASTKITVQGDHAGSHEIGTSETTSNSAGAPAILLQSSSKSVSANAPNSIFTGDPKPLPNDQTVSTKTAQSKKPPKKHNGHLVSTNFKYDDALSAIISEAKTLTHLPIDEDDDEEESDLRCSRPMRLGFTHLVPTSVPHGSGRGRACDATIRSSSSRSALHRSNSESHDPFDAMIMKRPLDGRWVKMRCKECGTSEFNDIKDFVCHSHAVHKLIYKSYDEAINDSGFPLVGMESPENPDVPETDHLRETGNQQPLIEAAHAARCSKPSWQENFVCMNKHDGLSKVEGPNEYSINSLQEMADFYDRTGNRWRMLAFRKAASILKKQKTKITTKEEALKLHGIGESIAEAIKKIVFTGRLNRLETAKDDPTSQVLQLFMGIYGVGLWQATKWIQAGFKTLDDIRKNANLTDNQKLGLEYYNDLQQRIPRAEIQQLGNIVEKALRDIDPAIEVNIGGSYRRGAESSGDIDFIITKPKATLHEIHSIVLDIMIPALTKDQFLVAELARTRSETGSKWHGCCRLPGPNNPWRRIDFLLVPWGEMGAALIYFTGNDIFNRSLRLLASKKGMRLNQRGLYRDVLRGRQREKVTEGSLIESRSEKKIFEILGVPWRPPEHRNC